MSENLNNKREYFRVTANRDATEGRGAIFDTPFAFWSRSEALKFVKSKYYAHKYGVMGYEGGEYDIKTVATDIRIFDSCEEALESVSKETLVKKALAKLTVEEQRILGLI